MTKNKNIMTNIKIFGYIIASLLIGALLAFGLSSLWWNLWMYHGIWGPSAALGTDGESAYDSVVERMFWIAWAALNPITLYVLLRSHYTINVVILSTVCIFTSSIVLAVLAT